jgi:hypothetical protein
MRKSKYWIIGALGLVLAGAILLLVFSSSGSSVVEDALETEINRWSNAGFLEWETALLNPTGLGLAYIEPDSAARHAFDRLKKSEQKDEFAWWLLGNIAMPEQQALLESVALEASANENPDRRYQGLSVLLRIASGSAPEKVKAQVEGDIPVHLKIALIRQLATFPREESVPVTQQLLETQARILAPEIQAEIRGKLRDFAITSSVVRESVPEEIRPAIALHISAILAMYASAPESRGRAEQIKTRLGTPETRELFRKISSALNDEDKGRKLEAVL